MTKVKFKEKVSRLINGEITISRLDFCLIGMSCLLAGICIGLLTAPFTHGVSIASNNASNNVTTNMGKNSDEAGEDAPEQPSA